MKKTIIILVLIIATVSYVNILSAAPLDSKQETTVTPFFKDKVIRSAALLHIIKDSFGVKKTAQEATDTVPEPATLLLFGAGIVGLISTHRSRVKSRR